jgi:hypothetical protein
LTRGHGGGEGDEVATAAVGANLWRELQPTDHGNHRRFRNVASLKTRGVDTVPDYFLNTARGKVTFSLNGTYTIGQRQQITPTAPVFDLVDTVGNTTSLRLVGKVSWSLKGWTVQSTVNYTGAYRDPPRSRSDEWIRGRRSISTANASLLGRQVSLQVVKRWGQ